ncbi:MAG: hypothetical protein AAF985_24855 [Bacteroidota bacterium]
MERQQIDGIDHQINKYYLDIKILLLDRPSYLTAVDTQNVHLYFRFLEASLKQSYNRINAVFTFVMGDDGRLIDKMYPFALLREDAKQIIDEKFAQAVSLIDQFQGNPMILAFEEETRDRSV